MPKITCEGYRIAYSKHDEACDGCKVAKDCALETSNKLTKAQGGSPMAKKLTEKQLKALLKKAKTAKSIKQIVSDNNYDVKLVKGMSIDDAKDAILKAAFPPADDPDDDFDDDDFVDDDASETAEETDDGSDDDFDDDDGADDGGADDDGVDDVAAEAAEPDGEEVEDLLARIEALEKRLDAYEDLMKKAPAGKAKSGKAEKEAIKAKLLEGCPYTKKTLPNLNGREVKQLASALGIKSFGLTREKVEAAILKSAANKKAGK